MYGVDMETITQNQQGRTAAEAAAAADFGRPSARKSGRDARWPYVPVLLVDDGTGFERQHQLRGIAYETRAGAIAHAEWHIDAARASLAERLAQPRYRALRQQYGVTR